LKLFLGPLASELKRKMVEDQHKLNGAAEEQKEEEEEVMNNEAATRSIIVASEAAHQIEPLTILAAVEPASSSTTTTTTTTTTQVVQITPASPNPKAITTPRAKVPLEKGYSQMVWLKLLRTEPDLAGSLSPLSL
jgi:CCR4-NOT transcriptional regulation complex NOT5 subunit